MNLPQETEKLALFAVLLGCTPKGRNIEQHDVMFGVAKTLEDLTDSMKTFWHKPLIHELTMAIKKSYPDVNVPQLEKELLAPVLKRDKVHIDAWTRVEHCDGYRVDIIPKHSAGGNNGLRLYFINLGGYLAGDFEEYHKKFFVVAANMSEALNKAKGHDFMKSHNAKALGKGATSHLDDQFKIDFEADDIICVSDQLEGGFVLQLQQVAGHPENEMVIGYKKLDYVA